MRKYKQKELKNLVAIGAAEDITGYDFEKMSAFLSSGKRLDKIGYSSGVYGINGGLLQNVDTGNLYAITSRNSALFMVF